MVAAASWIAELLTCLPKSDSKFPKKVKQESLLVLPSTPEYSALQASWPMEVEVALPVRLQSPPAGQAIILGLPGIEKLGLKADWSKNYICRNQGPLGFII